jgi:hypothetical protein
MERGKRYRSVTEAAEAIDEKAPYRSEVTVGREHEAARRN